jgi:hypothetical protein
LAFKAASNTISFAEEIFFVKKSLRAQIANIVFKIIKNELLEIFQFFSAGKH